MSEKRYTPEEARSHANETVMRAKVALAEDLKEIRTKNAQHA